MGSGQDAGRADDQKAPEVSVVIPARNAQGMIKDQLEALTLQQTDRPFEVIVVVNGCTDRTEEEARSFSGRLNLRVIHSEPGYSSSRNAGALAARSHVVLFCDADDAATPTWVEALSSAVERRHGIVGGFFGYRRFNPPGACRAYGFDPASPDGPEALMGEDEFKDALSKLGQLPDYDVAVDMGVWDTAEWWPYAYAPMLQSFGGDLIDRETYRTAEGFLNGTAAVEWGTWFRSLFADGYASQTPGTDGTDFLQSKVPLVYTGGWKVLKAQEALGEDEVLILPPVDFGKGAHVGGGSWQWGVSATSKNSEIANKFIEFLMQDEYLVKYSNAIGNFPSVASATAQTDNYGEGKPLEPVYEIGTTYALLRPATPGYKVISSVFDKAARDIVSGSDVQSALDQAVKDIDADIASNNGYQAT